MSYIENPKTKGSGIVCAIPQKGVCPVGCADCFFQSGRSYLEPLDQNLPNMPLMIYARGLVVRVNDGNDSNNKRDEVIDTTKHYPERFYNTSIPRDLEGFGAPVVLTVNPGDMTDTDAHLLDPVPKNLMFVRFRANPWNVSLGRKVVEHYTSRDIPVVLTFMAYYNCDIPEKFKSCYIYKKRTLNSYWVITQSAWNWITSQLTFDNPALVHTCGKDAQTHACKHCGHCLREYFATKCRMMGT